METGSGVSTLIAGYSLQKNGHGRMISLEHDKYYLNETAKSVEHHQLGNCVQVVYAPLTDLNLQGQKYSWYDRSVLNTIKPASIGILLVDGPPGNTQRLARYPALPVLVKYLKDDALVIVDDADRDDEREMIHRWRQEFRCLKVNYIPSEKGVAVMTFDHKLEGDLPKCHPQPDLGATQ